MSPDALAARVPRVSAVLERGSLPFQPRISSCPTPSPDEKAQLTQRIAMFGPTRQVDELVSQVEDVAVARNAHRAHRIVLIDFMEAVRGEYFVPAWPDIATAGGFLRRKGLFWRPETGGRCPIESTIPRLARGQGNPKLRLE